MSFILSALKKVENKRNLGSVPEVSSIQIQGFENPDKQQRRISVALSIVSIVAVTIFAALWFYKPLPEQTSPAQKMHSVLTTPPAVDGVIPKPQQTATVQTPTMQAPTVQSNIVPATAMPSNPAAPAAPYIIYSNPPPAQTPIYYPPNQPAAANNPAAAASPYLYQDPTDALKPKWEPLPVGIVNYEELPSGLRQRIPNIQLSAHIYSDVRPQARKVIINGVALRERQRLSDDLSVHQINADGVVMDYQGTLFLLGKNTIFN